MPSSFRTTLPSSTDQGIFLPVDGRKYQRASREVMAILRRFTDQVQPISIDEAFLDVTGSRALFGDGERSCDTAA